MADAWFYVNGGESAGPVTATELMLMASTKKLDHTSLVYHSTLSGWTMLSEVPELQSESTPPVPPVPPLPTKHVPNGGWKVRMTVDGGEFYHNVVTDAVSWEKPVELQSAEERQVDSSDCVWLPTPEAGGWVPATVVQRTAKHTRVRPIGGGADVDVPATGKHAAALDKVKLSHLAPRAMHDDLVLLESLTPALIAHCLRARFESGKIYTWVGADHSVLVSLNPFERLPLYGPSALAEFTAPSPNRLLPPHTYAIGAAALSSLRASQQPQSILISGESGAGKTEATKQVLVFLAEAVGSTTNVEQRILQVNTPEHARGSTAAHSTRRCTEGGHTGASTTDACLAPPRPPARGHPTLRDATVACARDGLRCARR